MGTLNLKWQWWMSIFQCSTNFIYGIKTLSDVYPYYILHSGFSAKAQTLLVICLPKSDPVLWLNGTWNWPPAKTIQTWRSTGGADSTHNSLQKLIILKRLLPTSGNLIWTLIFPFLSDSNKRSALTWLSSLNASWPFRSDPKYKGCHLKTIWSPIFRPLKPTSTTNKTKVAFPHQYRPHF